MFDSLQSGRDSLLFGIPFILLVIAGIFRLDELLIRRPSSRPQLSNSRRKPLRKSLLGCEPDGTPFDPDQPR